MSKISLSALIVFILAASEIAFAQQMQLYKVAVIPTKRLVTTWWLATTKAMPAWGNFVSPRKNEQCHLLLMLGIFLLSGANAGVLKKIL